VRGGEDAIAYPGEGSERVAPQNRKFSKENGKFSLKNEAFGVLPPKSKKSKTWICYLKDIVFLFIFRVKI
jgi:hypothetical protein